MKMTNNVTHDAVSYVDMVAECLTRAAQLEVSLTYPFSGLEYSVIILNSDSFRNETGIYSSHSYLENFKLGVDSIHLLHCDSEKAYL